MSVTLTQEQRAAIEARGQIIVSASAGSGKTFVMIERLVALVLGGADVRSILAVTFTNKAAEQMRDRLRLALIKGISEREGVEKERLKAQLAALPLAEISTIHAFCGRLIRTYFYAAGVDPAFRIVDGDDADGKALQARALDTVLEQAYEEKTPAFSLLLSVYFRKKKDAALRKTVTDLVKKMRERAGYERALADMGASDDFDALCAYLTQEYRSRADMVARGLREREHVYAGMGEKIAGYSDWLASVCACIAQQPDLFAMRENVPPKGQRPRRTSKTKVSAEEREALDFQAAAKAEADSLFEELEKYTDRETERARYLQANTVAQALGRLALAYDAAYMQEKREAGVLDYNDLEQIALHLLEDDVVRADVVARDRPPPVDGDARRRKIDIGRKEHRFGKDLDIRGVFHPVCRGYRGLRAGNGDVKHLGQHGYAVVFFKGHRRADIRLRGRRHVCADGLTAGRSKKKHTDKEHRKPFHSVILLNRSVHAC